MKKILVVDDEEDIRYIFKTHLSKEGHEVLTAEDCASAIEVISNTDVDLILADIILGARTGIDILKEVKEKGMQCPVIMITGDPNLETATEAVRLGAFDYVPKPVRKEMLLRMVNHALHHKTLLDEKDRIESEKDQYRRNLDSIFKSVKDAIVTVDNNLRVIEANEATRHICGFYPREVIGKTFVKIPEGCERTCHGVLEDTLKTKKTIDEYRIECKHQDRPDQVVVVTSTPLVDHGNRFTGAVLVVRDITRLTDLERELKEQNQFHQIVGKSQKMREIYRLLENLADIETTVLITGESGTGKELVAKALHYEGIRASGPMVTVNCSTLAENLLESELFGHIKGAFTGAVKNKVGRFQLANKGTILLDEIGDISPRIQLKLLRFLQEREFERVGDSKSIKVDVRVIAATNHNMKERVRSGEFREDLYYRLKVVEVSLPPLRERREDIPLLVQHFKGLFNKKLHKDIDDISNNVLAECISYPWPGNIRELEHAIEHAFVLCRGRSITVDHLPTEIRELSESKGPAPIKNHPNGPREILDALNETDWNKAKAARQLGISRRTIYRKIVEHKLTKPIK